MPTTDLPVDHRDLPMHDGRPRLLGLLDREDCLGRVMTPGVIYSLADRPCSSCKSGKRLNPGHVVDIEHLATAGTEGGAVVGAQRHHLRVLDLVAEELVVTGSGVVASGASK